MLLVVIKIPANSDIKFKCWYTYLCKVTCGEIGAVLKVLRVEKEGFIDIYITILRAPYQLVPFLQTFFNYVEGFWLISFGIVAN